MSSTLLLRLSSLSKNDTTNIQDRIRNLKPILDQYVSFYDRSYFYFDGGDPSTGISTVPGRSLFYPSVLDIFSSSVAASLVKIELTLLHDHDGPPYSIKSTHAIELSDEQIANSGIGLSELEILLKPLFGFLQRDTTKFYIFSIPPMRSGRFGNRFIEVVRGMAAMINESEYWMQSKHPGQKGVYFGLPKKASASLREIIGELFFIDYAEAYATKKYATNVLPDVTDLTPYAVENIYRRLTQKCALGEEPYPYGSTDCFNETVYTHRSKVAEFLNKDFYHRTATETPTTLNFFNVNGWIAMHFRGSDFCFANEEDGDFPVLGPLYFKECLDQIPSKDEIKNIVFFSNKQDEFIVRILIEYLKFYFEDCNFYTETDLYVKFNGDNSLLPTVVVKNELDLIRLMARFKYLVISNSSMAFWAGYLSNATIVFAPGPLSEERDFEIPPFAGNIYQDMFIWQNTFLLQKTNSDGTVLQTWVNIPGTPQKLQNAKNKKIKSVYKEWIPCEPFNINFTAAVSENEEDPLIAKMTHLDLFVLLYLILAKIPFNDQIEGIITRMTREFKVVQKGSGFVYLDRSHLVRVIRDVLRIDDVFASLPPFYAENDTIKSNVFVKTGDVNHDSDVSKTPLALLLAIKNNTCDKTQVVVSSSKNDKILLLAKDDTSLAKNGGGQTSTSANYIRFINDLKPLASTKTSAVDKRRHLVHLLDNCWMEGIECV
jgi:hypothetical protein